MWWSFEKNVWIILPPLFIFSRHIILASNKAVFENWLFSLGLLKTFSRVCFWPKKRRFKAVDSEIKCRFLIWKLCNCIQGFLFQYTECLKWNCQYADIKCLKKSFFLYVIEWQIRRKNVLSKERCCMNKRFSG